MSGLKIDNITIGGNTYVIQGNGFPNTNGSGDSAWNVGISIKYVAYPVITNCHINQNDGVPYSENTIGIELKQVYNPAISKCFVKGTWTYGIYHYGIASHTTAAGDWEDGSISGTFLVGNQKGLTVEHRKFEAFPGPNPIFVEPGYKVDGCHMNCFEYDMYFKNHRQIKIYGCHLYSGNRASNYDASLNPSSIIRLGQVSDVLISGTIFGAPGYYIDDDNATRSIWIEGQYAQHILISGCQFNASGVGIYNESSGHKRLDGTTDAGQNIVAVNNIFYGRGVGNIDQSFGPHVKFVDTTGGLNVIDNWAWNPDPNLSEQFRPEADPFA